MFTTRNLEVPQDATWISVRAVNTTVQPASRKGCFGIGRLEPSAGAAGDVDFYFAGQSTESLNMHSRVESTEHGLPQPRSAAAGTGAGETVEHPRDPGLFAIAIFKLAKAVFFFCLGVGAMHLMGKDLGDEVMRLATALRFDPESRAVSLVLDKIDLIDAQRLREIGIATFAYSAIALTEGTGLLLQKVWAEYLTLMLTISFLPWELYELARRPSWIRFALLVINLAVLWYLVWLLRRKRAIPVIAVQS